MCMFQDQTVYEVSSRERTGYKMVKISRSGNLSAPIQTGTRYTVGKWNVAGAGFYKGHYSHDTNPGFNIYTTKKSALSHLTRWQRWNDDATGMAVVQVTGRKVVSTGRNGFCAMELFISKSAAYQAKRTV